MKTVNSFLTEENIGERRHSYAFIAFLIFLTLIFAFTFFANVFVLFNVRVSGKSMENTLKEGDMLVVNKWRTPTYGDIVIIDQSDSTRTDYWIIKRVIALGGDTLKISGGQVYLKKSGETEFSLLDEPYANGDTQPEYGVREKTWELAENQVFFMGDNRHNSTDSRSSHFGPCDRSQILGVVSAFSVYTKDIRNFIYGLRTSCFGQ